MGFGISGGWWGEPTGRCVAPGLMKHETVPVGADKLNKMFSYAPDKKLIIASDAPVSSPNTSQRSGPLSSEFSSLSLCDTCGAARFWCLTGRAVISLAQSHQTHTDTHTLRVLLEVNVTEGAPAVSGKSFPPSLWFLSPFLSTLLKRPRSKALWEVGHRRFEGGGGRRA